MTTQGSDLTHMFLKYQVEEFLYQEAEILDERRFEEWLDLLTDDVRYWMPMRRNVKFGELEREFTREGQDINWFDEGKDTLIRRVNQILTGGPLGGGAAVPNLPHRVQRTGASGHTLSVRTNRCYREMPFLHLPQPRGNGNRPAGRQAGRRTA